MSGYRGGNPPIYAGNKKEKNKYRQRVHKWKKDGYVEGKDYVIESGVPILRRPRKIIVTNLSNVSENNSNVPTDFDLKKMSITEVIDLPYEAALRKQLLERKWYLEGLTLGENPRNDIPDLPEDLVIEVRGLGDRIADYLSKREPHSFT